jgi:hypothetical protein
VGSFLMGIRLIWHFNIIRKHSKVQYCPQYENYYGRKKDLTSHDLIFVLVGAETSVWERQLIF